MVLAFYYHYPILQKQNKVFLPGFLGVFVNQLAKSVTELVIIAHETKNDKDGLYDYELTSTNIRYILLGERTPAWHRHLFHAKLLMPLLKNMEGVDICLVRSPTPLAPFFSKYTGHAKVVYMVVGDYGESVKQIKTKSIRDWVMKQYVKHNDFLFRRSMKHTDLLVNAPSLYKKYKSIAKSVHQIKTTTLSEQDIYWREDVAQGEVIKLLYTGRIDKAKGLIELCEAFKRIHQTHPQTELHLVGWEENDLKPVEQELKTFATENRLADKIIFHGKKKVGPELNAFYQQCDFYVLPSYHEGFPRTIWEAMANGLPVIATTVGAIPAFLTHQQNAILIPPKQIEPIVQAFYELMQHIPLRKKMIQEGYKLAHENTLEKQTDYMVQQLHALQ